MPRPTRRARDCVSRAVALAALGAVACPAPADARITRLEIARVEPAFGGRSFGTVGTFERVVGRAHGGVDPRAPASAMIQDIGLAPTNARGMVEYVADVDILRPADPARGNGVLLFSIPNRGNKNALSQFNADVAGTAAEANALADPGDGWLQRQGYTLVWFGWQGDVLPGDGRVTLAVPVARNPDGSPVTGPVRSEFAVRAPTTTLSLAGGGTTHAAYPAVDTDNRAAALPDGSLPTLTVRPREDAPRVPIPNTAWGFAACPPGQPAVPDPTRICHPAGFEPGKIYELVYRARNPLVLGLGFAAARDLGTFLRAADRDDAGTPNPVAHGPGVRAIVVGSSQGGRMIRSFVHLGFNQGEAGGGRVFDGTLPHVSGVGVLPLSLRFAQPGRAWGQQLDHLYPGSDFPFAYARQTDPLTGRTQGLLDRCAATRTCPRIVHAAASLELWEARQSLGLTDPLGLRDAPEPPEVRSFVMAGTQHGPAALPLPPPAGAVAATEGGNACVQQPNPNPQIWTMRALLDGLTAWVRDGREPPASAVPRVADGTLVAPDAVRFPAVPANAYGGVERPALRYAGAVNPLRVLDYGPGYRAGDTGGVITVEPPRRAGTAGYGILVPQVDADGNDLGGARSLHLSVPVGTYTAWNRFRQDWFGGGFCHQAGGFVPFARTRAERAAAGDPRPSLEERYPDRRAYVAAVGRVAAELVGRRLLLREDADRLVAEAERDGIRSGP